MKIAYILAFLPFTLFPMQETTRTYQVNGSTTPSDQIAPEPIKPPAIRRKKPRRNVRLRYPTSSLFAVYEHIIESDPNNYGVEELPEITEPPRNIFNTKNKLIEEAESISSDEETEKNTALKKIRRDSI